MAERAGGLNALFAATQADFAGWGVASIVSSMLLLLAYSLLPDVRRTPGWQFLYSSVCEICVAVGFVVLSLIGSPQGGQPAAPVNVEHILCAEYGNLLYSIFAFDVAANSWRLLMYVDLIVVYYNPFRPHTLRPLYHALVIMFAAGWVASISRSGLLCSPDLPWLPSMTTWFSSTLPPPWLRR